MARDGDARGSTEDHRELGDPGELAELGDPGELGELVFAQESVRSVLTKVADVAVTLVAGPVQASVTLINRGSPTTTSWTGQLAFELDETQYAMGFGPCLQAATTADMLIVTDMTTETRWPAFAALAHRQGAHSQLAVPLLALEGLRACINVYGELPGLFDDQAQQAIQRLARRAAVSITNMHDFAAIQATVEGLHTAMSSRAQIEQAKGILMARGGLTAPGAFGELTEMSQRTNRKLRAPARDIVAGVSHDPARSDPSSTPRQPGNQRFDRH